MTEHPFIFASEEEIEELRSEIRTLRQEQERQKKQSSSDPSKGGKDASDNPKKPDEKGKAEDSPDDKKDPEEEKKPHPLRTALIIIGVLLLAVVAIVWWLYSRQFETTDDAVVDGHISGLAARVEGTVTGVYVEEDQFVKAGQVLVDLDPRDYTVALQQARSQLMQTQAQAAAEQPNIPVTQVTNQTNISTTASSVAAATAGVAAARGNYEAALAKVREAEANNAKAQADVERYRPLAARDEVSHEQFDQVLANAKALAATVAANRASADAARQQVEQNREQLAEAEQRASEAKQNAPRQVAIRQATVAARRATAQGAEAQLEQAQLNLSYCKIVSPVDGIVAKRVAELGQRVTPGQQVMLITQIADLWVTANYKETQVRRMHNGQSVRIHVDAVAADFDGYIESMPAASGSITSLLPPENATGNFVKVVQRLPVRIRFKADQPGLDRLRPGMSVEPKTRVD